LNGPSKKPGIGCNDVERQPGVGCFAVDKVEGKRSRHGGIEESQPVFPRLNVEVRPGLSVLGWPVKIQFVLRKDRITYDMDNIPPEAVRLAMGRKKSSVAIVLLGGQDKRNIVDSVTAGKVKRILRFIGDDVSTGLTHVGILGGLVQMLA